jgi:hypothetical protein
MADVPLEPWLIEIEVGLADNVKSGVIDGVIVMSSTCEWLKLPPVPRIITEIMAFGVPVSTVIVAVEVTVPPAGGVTLVGENATCTPDGSAPVARFTVVLNPPNDVIVSRSVVELPEPMVSGPRLESEKSAVGVTVSVNVVL